MKESKKKLADAREAYLAIAQTASPVEARAAHEKVEAAQKELAAQITKGAKPCPICGQPPHGMEQPSGRDGVEYEIGCIPCKAFVHTDGTVREPRVRGGLLPKHAVEAWNEGPDFWRRAKNQDPKNPDLGPAPKQAAA